MSAVGSIGAMECPALVSEQEGSPRGKTRPAAESGTLLALFRAYRGRILLTYALFSLENLLRLAQPVALGLAVDGLLHSSYFGLLVLVAQHLAHLLVGSVRRAYDTRAFTVMYADLASRLVVEQRGRGVDVSRVAARSALSREFVTFFERDMSDLLWALYSVVGALVVLGWREGPVVFFCLAMAVPSYLLNVWYGRRTLFLSRGLHDEFEREVEVIGRSKEEEVRAHYERVARWRVRLSDCQALNFGLMELFILALIAASVVRFCTTAGASAGGILAMFQYLWIFLRGLDRVPDLVHQMSRLRDIGRRIWSAAPGDEVAESGLARRPRS